MKYSSTLLSFAALLAIICGVLFKMSYPSVEISAGIVSLCVLLGIVTSLAVAAVWNVLIRPEMPPSNQKPSAPPAGIDSRTRPPGRRKRQRTGG